MLTLYLPLMSLSLTTARVLTSPRLTITQQPLPLSSAPASLTCSVASDSLPDIAWYRDGVLVPGRISQLCNIHTYYHILDALKELTTQGLAECLPASERWCPPWRSDAAPGYTCTRVWPVLGARCFQVRRLWSYPKMSGGIVTKGTKGRRRWQSGSATLWSRWGMGWSLCVNTWSILGEDTWHGHVTIRWTFR